MRNIYHHHPESKKRKSSEANSGSIHPYGRYGNAVKTRKIISTIAILWPVKAIFEKRAATVEVDTLISPALRFAYSQRIEGALGQNDLCGASCWQKLEGTYPLIIERHLRKAFQTTFLVLGSALPRTGSPGPFGPGTPEESEKSPERVPSQKPDFRTLFGLFSDSFETPGRTLSGLWGSCPGGLFRDSFRTLPGFRARRGRETLCGAAPILILVEVTHFLEKKVPVQGPKKNPKAKESHEQYQRIF